MSAQADSLRAAAALLDGGADDGRLLLSRGQDTAAVAAMLRSEADQPAPNIHAVELARLLLAREP